MCGISGGVWNYWITKIPIFESKAIESLKIAVVCAVASAICVDVYKWLKKWVVRKFFR